MSVAVPTPEPKCITTFVCVPNIGFPIERAQ